MGELMGQAALLVNTAYGKENSVLFSVSSLCLLVKAIVAGSVMMMDTLLDQAGQAGR